MKILLTIFLTAGICFSQITIDAMAPALPIPMRTYLGYGHDAPYYEQDPAYKMYHQMLLASQHKRPLTSYVRFFNTLSYKENADGSLNSYAESIGLHPYDTKRYAGGFDFTKMNQVMDELVSYDMKPIFEFGFMPQCLSVIPVDEGSFGEAIISPPSNYDTWREVVRRVTLNLESRYGNKLNDWIFGVWNEPNYNEFWDFGTYGYSGFIKLYDIAQSGALAINPNLIFSGPDNTAVLTYSKQFVQHCFNGTNYATGLPGTKLDYFTIHQYSVNPRNIAREAWNMIRDSKEIYGYEKPVMITECAPSADMWAQPFTQSEYAAIWSLALLDICLSTADIYGSVYMPKSILYHGDIRQWTFRSVMIYAEGEERNELDVLKSPLFNLWEMLSYMSSDRIPVQGCDFPAGTLVVNDGRDFTLNQFRCLATRTPGRSIEILLYQWDQSHRMIYNKQDHGTNPPEAYGNYIKAPEYVSTTLTVNNLNGTYRVKKYLLDRYHSNVFGYKFDVNDTENYTILNQHDDLECISDEILFLGSSFTESISIQKNSAMLIVLENTDITPPPKAPKNFRIKK